MTALLFSQYHSWLTNHYCEHFIKLIFLNHFSIKKCYNHLNITRSMLTVMWCNGAELLHCAKRFSLPVFTYCRKNLVGEILKLTLPFLLNKGVPPTLKLDVKSWSRTLISDCIWRSCASCNKRNSLQFSACGPSGWVSSKNSQHD